MTEEVDLGIPGIGTAILIGQGGFGRVYRALQTSFDGVVAVKVVAGHLDGVGRARFEREARALGALRGHPHICTVFDAGVGPHDQPYIVMEYAPTTLAQRITESGALPWADAMVLGVQLSGALHTAHVSGLLHRDVKPENVLIGSFGVPKLADFGLARFSDDTVSAGITTTVSHAAPELLRGESPSVASDVYALGSTVFAALAGRVAFALSEGAHGASLYRRIEEDPVPEIPGVPAGVADVVRTAMAKDPGERYETASALGEAIQEAQRALGVPVTSVPLAGEDAVAGAVAVGADAAEVRTLDGATPRARTSDGLTEVVRRENRGRLPVEDLPQEVVRRTGRSSKVWVVLAGVVLVGVIVAVAFIRTGGDDGDAAARVGGSSSSDETTTSTATTAPPMSPNSPRRIVGNWSLSRASFKESTFCDAASCLRLHDMAFTIDCGDSPVLGDCDISVDGIGSGFLERGPVEDSWTAFLLDVQGPAQLLCGGEPVSTYVDLELHATGAAPVDGSAVTLEGTYRATIDDPAACSGEDVAYDIVMAR